VAGGGDPLPHPPPALTAYGRARGRFTPFVVPPKLQYKSTPMGGFAIGARVALLWQNNANPSYKLASIPRYDDIVRTAGWAGSARAAGQRPAGRIVVSVSTSRSRDVSTSRLGLVSTKIFNVSVSSPSRPLTSRARDLFSTKFCRSQY